MNPARMLKRAAAIGLTIVALTALGTLAHPAAAVEAAILPDTHAGAPDIGYPCPGTNTRCDLHAIAPTSGDIGYPWCPSGCVQFDPGSAPPAGDVGYPVCPSGCSPDLHSGGCPGPCAIMDVVAPASSGDVGYPNNCEGGCGVLEGTSPTSSGDIGYPGCPGGCRFDLQPGRPASGDVGYPGCPSGCRSLDTNPPAVDDEIVAAKQPLNPSGWGDGTANN